MLLNKKNLRSLICLFLLLGAVASARESPSDTVLAKIASLSRIWNSGDMQTYLANYHNSEQLTIMMSSGIIRGKDAMSELFGNTWSNESAMGDFTTSGVTARELAPGVVIATGNFEHVFAHETVAGNFSQVWRLFPHIGWRIVHEHTARAEVGALHDDAGAHSRRDQQ